jgi:hypothetical protein
MNRGYSFEFLDKYIDNIMDYMMIYNTLSLESHPKPEKIKTFKKEVYKVIVQRSARYWRQ